MPKQGVALLSDVAARTAKPKDKPYPLRDGGGLWLVVEPSGRKWWKLRVVFAKKENSFSLGDYPAVSLADAREKQQAARKNIAAGIDPGAMRKAEKATQSGEGSFEAVAREWVALKSPAWSPSHTGKTISILEKDVFPYVGSRPIGEITAPEMLALLKRVDTRSPVTARKAYSTCRQIFFNAIAHGRATTNPADGLTVLLSPKRVKHMAAPTEQGEVSRLLKALPSYSGTFPVRCALMLSPIFFVRPGTMRGMEWQDVDLDRAEWRIPIEQLKRRQIDKDARRGEIGLIVPLPRQAVAILRELHPLTGGGRFVFSRDAPQGKANKRKYLAHRASRYGLYQGGYHPARLPAHGVNTVARNGVPLSPY